jgi:hypothetical protein
MPVLSSCCPAPGGQHDVQFVVVSVGVRTIARSRKPRGVTGITASSPRGSGSVATPHVGAAHPL